MNAWCKNSNCKWWREKIGPNINQCYLTDALRIDENGKCKSFKDRFTDK